MARERIFTLLKFSRRLQPASVARLDVRPTGNQEDAGLIPRRVRQNSFVEIDHEIFPIVILSIPQIQERMLTVSGKRMCTSAG